MKKNRGVLELENVCKYYGKGHSLVKALDDVSFKVREGDYIVVIGPSGSGKSTLLNMIGLLDEPTAGKVYVDEINTSTMDGNRKAEVRNKKIGFVFQTFNLIPSLTALENVEIPQVIFGEDKEKRKEKAMDVLKKLGIEDRATHLPSELSGGERQRVAVARALVNDPEIILADEPTGNLDTKRGDALVNILRELNSEGRTVVIVTHDMDIAKKSKRVIKLKDGMVISRK